MDVDQSWVWALSVREKVGKMPYRKLRESHSRSTLVVILYMACV